jgi:hypothetical protein
MSNSSFVTSAKVKIRQGDVNADKPNSSAVNRKLSASINGLIDSAFYKIESLWSGYAIANTFADQAPIFIYRQCSIVGYYMSINKTTSAGDNCLNFRVYDQDGFFINNLFGSGANRLLFNAANKDRVVVGYDLDRDEPIAINLAGSTFQYGNLNLTTLNAGWFLVPFIENSTTNSQDKRIEVRLREL